MFEGRGRKMAGQSKDEVKRTTGVPSFTSGRYRMLASEYSEQQ